MHRGPCPDAVVTLASRDVRVGLTEPTPPGFVARWQQPARGHSGAGDPGQPAFDRSMPDCVQSLWAHRSWVQRPGARTRRLRVERAAVYAAEPPWTHVPDVPANVRFLDIADRVCGPAFCPAVIGNVLVYLDDNHLTASYSTSMAPLVEGDVLAALGF